MIVIHHCICDSDTTRCQATQCAVTGKMGHGLRTCLKQMSSKRLFAECLASEKQHRTISGFLQMQPNAVYLLRRAALSLTHRFAAHSPGKQSGAFERFPVEITNMILLQLTMLDRIHFGATCRTNRIVANRALLTAAALCLQPYNLSLVELRFLQCCTKTFISGSVLRRLLFTGQSTRPPQSTLHKDKSDPVATEEELDDDERDDLDRPTLDLYCPEYEGLVVATFIAHATGYTIGPYYGDLETTDGVQDAHTLTKLGAPSINVFEAWSENPLDAILQLPTTADMNAWMLDHIWIGYPCTTLNGLAITTPPRLPLGDPDNEDLQGRAWDVLHSHMRDGFTVHSDLPGAHSAISSTYVWKRVPAASWTIGASARCSHTTMTNPARPRSYKFHESESKSNPLPVIIWKDEFQTIMEMSERPE
ncbi:hypothetical protein C8R43DRAFT_942404 [Mycena crocata]|nr:hypothetical protein C8R43DRAFT_942404 [Mycena crocata]